MYSNIYTHIFFNTCQNYRYSYKFCNLRNYRYSYGLFNPRIYRYSYDEGTPDSANFREPDDLFNESDSDALEESNDRTSSFSSLGNKLYFIKGNYNFYKYPGIRLGVSK